MNSQASPVTSVISPNSPAANENKSSATVGQLSPGSKSSQSGIAVRPDLSSPGGPSASGRHVLQSQQHNPLSGPSPNQLSGLDSVSGTPSSELDRFLAGSTATPNSSGLMIDSSTLSPIQSIQSPNTTNSNTANSTSKTTEINSTTKISSTSTSATNTSVISSSRNKHPISNSAGSSLEPRKRIRRVDPDKRKRTAMACINCKKRKKKCNGEQPCILCKERRLDCIYIKDPSSSIDHNPGTPGFITSPASVGDNNTTATNNNNNYDVNGSPRHHYSSITNNKIGPGMTAKSARRSDKNYRIDPRPDGKESSRMLRTNGGKLHFVGESCTLALLEQVRVLFSQILGTSSFTEDPERFNMVEGPQPKPASAPVQLPSKELANKLIDLFELNIHALFYVLDSHRFYSDVTQIFRNPISAQPSSLCILHLVFALGSLFYTSLDSNVGSGTAGGGDGNDGYIGSNQESSKIPSTVFFNSALTFLDESVVDVGETWVVEAYLLSSFYYELTCRRNSSWIQLGKAIRYAQALGMGKHWASRSFPLDIQQHRNRLWQTLYIQDRLKSVFLGRPMMIDNNLPESLYDDASSVVSDNSSVAGGRHSGINTTTYSPVYPYFVRLSEILGNIYHDLYESESVYSRTAQQLIAKLKDWCASFETMQSTQVRDASSQKILVVVNTMYLHGIVLLTRPFLFYTVAKKAQLKNTHLDDALRTFESLAIACVQGSLATIRIVTSMFYEGWHPWRSPLIVYCVFTCGMILLLDAFQCRCTSSALDENVSWAISSCMNILSHYSSYDISAKRYLSILTQMNTSVFTNWEPQMKNSQEESQQSIQPLLNQSAPQQQRQQQQQQQQPRLPSQPARPSQPSLPPQPAYPRVSQPLESSDNSSQLPSQAVSAEPFPPMPSSLMSYGNTPFGGASPVPESLQQQLQLQLQQQPLFSITDINVDDTFDNWSFTSLGPIMNSVNHDGGGGVINSNDPNNPSTGNGTNITTTASNGNGTNTTEYRNYAGYLLSEFEPTESLLASGF